MWMDIFQIFGRKYIFISSSIFPIAILVLPEPVTFSFWKGAISKRTKLDNLPILSVLRGQMVVFCVEWSWKGSSAFWVHESDGAHRNPRTMKYGLVHRRFLIVGYRGSRGSCPNTVTVDSEGSRRFISKMMIIFVSAMEFGNLGSPQVVPIILNDPENQLFSQLLSICRPGFKNLNFMRSFINMTTCDLSTELGVLLLDLYSK